MDADRPTVTVNDAHALAAETPPAAGAGIIVDAKGRKLTLRELTLLEEQDFLAAMPENHYRNQLVLGRSLMAVRIATINGEEQDVPITQAQYRAMLQAVGREGIDAVAMADAKNAAGAGGENDLEDSAKNS